MKNHVTFILSILLFCLIHHVNAQEPSAIVNFESSTQGVLIPRMTNVQIAAIASPAEGLQVYSLDDGCIHLYTGTAWTVDCGGVFNTSGPFPPETYLWRQLNDYTGPGASYATAFVLLDTAYIGLGTDGSAQSAFYKYDPSGDTWTSIAAYPAVRQSATSFVIGDTAYVGLGSNGVLAQKTFYKYDKTADAWVSIADLPGDGRIGAVAFVVNGKGYVGLGKNQSAAYLTDFYAYDPATGAWTSVTSYPGLGVENACAFDDGTLGYVGLGLSGSGPSNAVYAYDPGTNAWTSRANYPGGARSEAVAVGTSTGALVGLGIAFGSRKKDFYTYDPQADTWTSFIDFPQGMNRGIGFSLLDDVYVGLGLEPGYSSKMYRTDLEKYVSSSNADGESMWTISGLSGVLSNDNSAGNQVITDLSDPVNSQDAVTKAYVDGQWILTGSELSNANGGDVNIDANTLFVDVSTNSVGIGTNTPGSALHVKKNDNSFAGIWATGDSQGTGVFYAGQSTSFGGGFLFDGDNNPAVVGGTDRLTFFRRNGGTDYEVFSFPYNVDDVTFKGDGFFDGGLVVNDAGSNFSFRTESQGNPHMLYIEALNNRVGIGTGSPSHTLDVAGDAEVNGKLEILPANNNVGIFINHDKSTNGATLSLSVDLDNTYTGDPTLVVAGSFNASKSGAGGDVLGVSAVGQNDNTSNGLKTYGIWASAHRSLSATNSASYGVYGTVGGNAASNYAGYFDGDVYTTGSYLPSDRKLKSDFEPYTGALEKLMNINAFKYKYDLGKYHFMNLQEGSQIGMLAEDVRAVFPQLVKSTIHPAQIVSLEHAKRAYRPGEYTTIGDSLARVGFDVPFEAVNYAGFVPILIQAVKEQQAQISALELEISSFREDEMWRLRDQEVDALRKEVEALRALIESMVKE